MKPDITLTAEERKAIKDLKRLAKTWPKTLWLFVGGSVNVMRCDANGDQAMRRNGGVDPDYMVASITMPCDGGDW